MQRLILTCFMVTLAITGLFLPAVQAAETSAPPSIRVDADGKVLASPDLAGLTLEVETQAPTAAAAGTANARAAANVFKALKGVLGPQDRLRTLGYRLTPVYAPKTKSSPPKVKAYRAVNRIEVKITDVTRLGKVIDASLQSGASRVTGPYWSHSNLDELQRQAAVNAYNRARSLAAALAQAAKLKITGVGKISTGLRLIAPRASRADFLMAKAAPPTPIEPGQEEIRAHVQVEFLVSP
jgi:uncharacterized protein